MKPTIFFSAGDPSGDQHTARLIHSLRAQNSELEFRGFGGHDMESAGCKIDFELTQLAVMGLVEVLPKIRDFYRVASDAERIFAQQQIDAVVLVDFPGFNWHIAKRAKKFNIPVYYYLPPQLWAWAPWRIRKLRRNVDAVLSVLPFEDQWYQERNVQTQYVGHPFFDAVREQSLDEQTITQLDRLAMPGKRLIAVLPGSRRGEVSENWPLQLEAIRRLAKKHVDVQFVVACFKDRHCLMCREQMSADDASLPIEFFVGRTSEIIEVCDCAMMVSGSVSLEMMARETPAVVLYRLGRVFYTLAKMMVRLDSITLPNLIAGKTLYPETLSVGNTEQAIEFVVDEVDRMLRDPQYVADFVAQLRQLKGECAKSGASERAAGAILNLMQLDAGTRAKNAA